MIYKGCDWFFLTSVGVWIDMSTSLTFCEGQGKPILKVRDHFYIFSYSDGTSKMSDDDTESMMRCAMGLLPENFYTESDLESVDY